MEIKPIRKDRWAEKAVIEKINEIIAHINKTEEDADIEGEKFIKWLKAQRKAEVRQFGATVMDTDKKVPDLPGPPGVTVEGPH